MRRFRRDMAFRLFTQGGFVLLPCAALMTPSAWAANLTLDRTTITNTDNQVINVNISGVEQIAGSDLYVQINDGGTDNLGTTNNGGPVAATISNIDMTQGVFLANNSGNAFFVSPDGLMGLDSISTNGTPATTVSDNGQLAAITLNASDMTGGSSFTLQFFDVGENDLNFGGGATSDYIDSLGNSFTPTGAGMLGSVTVNVVTPLIWNNSLGTGSGVFWDAASQNWINNGSPAFFSTNDNVLFNDNNNHHYSVTLNSTVSPGSVTLNNSAGNYTISGTGGIAGTGSLTKLGSGTATLSTVNTYSGGTTVNGGVLNIAANGALPNGNVSIGASGTLQLATNTGLAKMTNLSITSGGVLDVGNNHVIITYGANDPVSAIRAYLASGYNGGTWNGPGINSSTAALPANKQYALGYADGADGIVAGLPAGQIEVKYTLYGDANLDGIVSGDDFTILAANLGKQVNSWDKGDFDYDGLVTGDDFTLLVGNLGKQDNGADVTLPSSDYAAIDAFVAANGLMADVPEPASVSVIMLAGLGMLGRRREQKRPA